MLVLNCPRCEIGIEISASELNCKIFRCGVYKHTYQQINPHSSLEECELLVRQNKIFGCGYAFEIIENTENSDETKIIDDETKKEYYIRKCDYSR